LALAHDCDGPGYIIAHTIAEATPRMPSYKVKVIDLGLNVADTIRLGLDRSRTTARTPFHSESSRPLATSR
jgi:hypothetical protein